MTPREARLARLWFTPKGSLIVRPLPCQRDFPLANPEDRLVGSAVARTPATNYSQALPGLFLYLDIKPVRNIRAIIAVNPHKMLALGFAEDIEI